MNDIRREAYILHIGPLQIDIDEVRAHFFGDRLFWLMAEHDIVLTPKEAHKLRKFLNFAEWNKHPGEKYEHLAHHWYTCVDKAITDRTVR